LRTMLFCCYFGLCVIMAFCAWRFMATSETLERLLDQQTQILAEIRDAREAIPVEVKAAIPDVLRDGK
jgi:hypothetical protein